MSEDEQPKTASRRDRIREELTRKGGVPDSAHTAFRKWSRKVWESRGGGPYALGFIVTFLYLEITDILFDDVPTLVTMNILSGDLISFVISFIIDTLMNTFYALIWPVLLIEWDATIGIVILVAIYTLYPKVVQEPLENWLFEGEGPPEKDSGDKG